MGRPANELHAPDLTLGLRNFARQLTRAPRLSARIEFNNRSEKVPHCFVGSSSGQDAAEGRVKGEKKSNGESGLGNAAEALCIASFSAFVCYYTRGATDVGAGATFGTAVAPHLILQI